VWPSVVTNAVWAVVGAHAVAVVLKARRKRMQDAAQAPVAAPASAAGVAADASGDVVGLAA
jgi:hypothetical protein